VNWNLARRHGNDTGHALELLGKARVARHDAGIEDGPPRDAERRQPLGDATPGKPLQIGIRRDIGGLAGIADQRRRR
jgi:hypothetical protein